MFPNDSPPVRGRACLVVDDPSGLSTDAPALRDLLQNGWTVHVLVCAGTETGVAARLRAAGIGCTDLTAIEPPADFRVHELHGDGPAERSELVRHAVEGLHREHRFGVIEFSARGGLGARAVQAKRAGLALTDVTLAVRLDGNTQRDRESRQRWPSDFAAVEGDYLERFAFEGADIQCVPDDALTAFVRRNGWMIRPDAVTSAVEYSRSLEVANPNVSSSPLVTIAIAHHNLGRYFPDTLATLAAQTYPNIEVIAIDDGSTDAASVEVFESMRARYPAYRFLRQENAGIGATRNRCLELATGEFFVPVDADNLARPDMIARFVTGMQRNPGLSAMTCYFLAFDVDAPNLHPERYLYAHRPVGGPHALAGIRNVYGDANAIFRTAALRAVGGYETDRGTSCEDWEAFVKLVHAGHKIGVVPEHLFYYRYRPGGFSRSTNWFANHQRVLRQFANPGTLPPADALTLWTALLGFHQQLEYMQNAQPPRRHKFADRAYSVLGTPLKWVRRIGRR
ncbi:glycosyltransferase family 2 protein [Gemmata sp. SH-PL17]|uniref:glycosyltransferase family 2 protein n=1 Tax=Gemmata sp. SH-PL17 TaxID=1630693 RepID=UPI000698B125|nr:glycosyltransferase family A protein [Gemmata sp. SH-PL17]